jgi:secreted trypsin-like serine protease
VTRESYAVTREPDLGALAEGQSMEFPAEAVTVRAWVKHPEYSLTSGNMMAPDGLGAFHDIALMFLSAPLQGVTPAVVITADERAQLAADAAVTIAGWGQQTATSGPLQQPPPGTVGRKVCGASLGPETTRKCRGDSGGPTYINVNTDSPVTERVIGVTSRAYSAAEDCNAGGVDTRVDAYLDWLDTEMRDACTEGTRTACDEPGLLPPPPAAGSSSSSSSSGSTGGSSSSSSGDAQGSGGDSGGPADGCTQSGAGPWAGLGLLAVVLARVRRAVRARR